MMFWLLAFVAGLCSVSGPLIFRRRPYHALAIVAAAPPAAALLYYEGSVRADDGFTALILIFASVIWALTSLIVGEAALAARRYFAAKRTG